MKNYPLLFIGLGLLLPTLSFASTTVNVSVTCVVTSNTSDGVKVVSRTATPSLGNICSSVRGQALEVDFSNGARVSIPANQNGPIPIPSSLSRSGEEISVTNVKAL